MSLAELIKEELRKENPLGPIMEKMVTAIHDGIKKNGEVLVCCNRNIEKSHVDYGSVCIAKKDESVFVDWCRENGLRMRESYNHLSGGRMGYILSI